MQINAVTRQFFKKIRLIYLYVPAEGNIPTKFQLCLQNYLCTVGTNAHKLCPLDL